MLVMTRPPIHNHLLLHSPLSSFELCISYRINVCISHFCEDNFRCFYVTIILLNSSLRIREMMLIEFLFCMLDCMLCWLHWCMPTSQVCTWSLLSLIIIRWYVASSMANFLQLVRKCDVSFESDRNHGAHSYHIFDRGSRVLSFIL